MTDKSDLGRHMPRPDPKFTPGPWEIVPYGDGDSLVIHSSDENRVCFMATHGGTRSQWERIQENARLIAAAPRMAEYVRARAEAGDAEANEIWEAILG